MRYSGTCLALAACVLIGASCSDGTGEPECSRPEERFLRSLQVAFRSQGGDAEAGRLLRMCDLGTLAHVGRRLRDVDTCLGRLPLAVAKELARRAALDPSVEVCECIEYVVPERDAGVPEAVASALASCGQAAFPMLVRLLGGDEGLIRYYALKQLKVLQEKMPPSVELLAAVAGIWSKQPSAYEAQMAKDVISGAARSNRDVAMLISALEQFGDEALLYAVGCLLAAVHGGEPAAWEGLRSVLVNGSREVRLHVLRG